MRALFLQEMWSVKNRKEEGGREELPAGQGNAPESGSSLKVHILTLP
jgi:hypothetical protein